jgi:ribosomal protein L39E
MVRFDGIQWRDKSKAMRNLKSRFWECQVHNRRLSEFRIKRSISKAHRRGREVPIFVVSLLKWTSAVVGVVHGKAEEAQPLR